MYIHNDDILLSTGLLLPAVHRMGSALGLNQDCVVNEDVYRIPFSLPLEIGRSVKNKIGTAGR